MATNPTNIINDIVGALQASLAQYAPSQLNVAPPTINTTANIDKMLGTNMNRSKDSIYAELANIINTAYNAAMSDQTTNERTFIQALANVADSAQDTMRNQYGAAASLGANRGMYAADVLSAILGMQNTSMEGLNNVFGNRSVLLNNRANDLAGAASDAQSTYTALQQYLADYAKSIYETDSTNHVAELSSWNAYLDALANLLPGYFTELGANNYYGGVNNTNVTTPGKTVTEMAKARTDSLQTSNGAPYSNAAAYTNAATTANSVAKLLGIKQPEDDKNKTSTKKNLVQSALAPNANSNTAKALGDKLASRYSPDFVRTPSNVAAQKNAVQGVSNAAQTPASAPTATTWAQDLIRAKNSVAQAANNTSNGVFTQPAAMTNPATWAQNIVTQVLNNAVNNTPAPTTPPVKQTASTKATAPTSTVNKGVGANKNKPVRVTK